MRNAGVKTRAKVVEADVDHRLQIRSTPEASEGGTRNQVAGQEVEAGIDLVEQGDLEVEARPIIAPPNPNLIDQILEIDTETGTVDQNPRIDTGPAVQDLNHSCEQSSTSKSKSSRVKKEVVSVKERIPKNGKGSPDCVIVDNTVLNEINEDTFTPKQFSSTKSKKVPDNIVIDLRKNTIKVPEVEQLEPDSIFHHSLFLNEEARMEKWVKDLYSFRQKALQPSVKN
ncbi:hypothetical protein JTB14_013503 [Gonioctena quinquepunctata]|nr:hypothetical protein JTB14_013503 [Gonioctena quinquepunctata]